MCDGRGLPTAVSGVYLSQNRALRIQTHEDAEQDGEADAYYCHRS